MFATAIIVFREVLEMAIVITLVLAATRGTAGRMGWVLGGIGAGLAGSVTVAGFAESIAQFAEGMGQEIFNAGILFAAVSLLAWTIAWMRKHGSEMAQNVTRVGKDVASGTLPFHTLAVVVGLAVMREGSETVLFLYGVAASGSTTAMDIALGGLLGVIAASAIAGGMYAGLLAISSRYVFAVTGGFLTLLAAGMAAQGANFLAQAGILPSFGSAVWDTSHIISQRDVFGQLLHILIGYADRPSGIQVIFYLFTLATIIMLTFFAGRPGATPRGRNPRRSADAMALILCAAGTLVFRPHPAAALDTKVYSPHVVEGELAFEQRGFAAFDGDPQKDRFVKTRYELEYGLTSWWKTALIGEAERSAGKDGPFKYTATALENLFQLTEPGEYWLDLGFYTELESPVAEEDPYEFEWKLLLEKDLGQTTHRLNLIFSKTFGLHASSRVDATFGWASFLRYREWLQPGFEVYGEPGDFTDRVNNQSYRIGPVLYGTLPGIGNGKFKYEIGYLAGITTATPSSAVKWLMEYEVHF